MPAKYWLEVKDGVAYNKVWSSDGVADVQEHWVEIPEEASAQIGWLWDGSSFTESNTSVEDLRTERDILLSTTDFTQLADSPLSVEQKALWTAYRQDLRNLPGSYVPVPHPEWPTPPE